MSSNRREPDGSPTAAEARGPRLPLPWLVVSLLAALALGVLREEAPKAEVWHLAASGAAVTLAMVLLAMSLGLLMPKAKEPRP